MMDLERQRWARHEAAHHREYQHEVPTHKTGNATHRTVSDDHLPPRARRRVSKAPTTQQELRRLARHRHRRVGRVATGQSPERNSGPRVRHRWCGLRLTHRSPRDLVRDRRSPRFAGHRQGYAGSRRRIKTPRFKRLVQLERCNPGYDLLWDISALP